MEKKLLLYVFILLAGVMMYSCKPDDTKIQQNVEKAIAATNLPVISSVKDGVVTLTGIVQSEEAKASAEQAVRVVKDVKSVMNNIQVEAPVVINPDNTLSTTVRSALDAGGFNGVNVSVSNGEVTLTGEIKRADLTKVMQIANESNPAKVNNQLTVK